jgi:hypothetical protein
MNTATKTALACLCLTAAALAQTQAQTPDLYRLPGSAASSAKSRASTAENPNGKKG